MTSPPQRTPVSTKLTFFSHSSQHDGRINAPRAPVRRTNEKYSKRKKPRMPAANAGKSGAPPTSRHIRRTHFSPPPFPETPRTSRPVYEEDARPKPDILHILTSYRIPPPVDPGRSAFGRYHSFPAGSGAPGNPSSKCTEACAPSQKGLLDERPQRHSVARLRTS